MARSRSLTAAIKAHKQQLVAKYGPRWFQKASAKDFSIINDHYVYGLTDEQVTELKNELKPKNFDTDNVKTGNINTVTVDVTFNTNAGMRTTTITINNIDKNELDYLRRIKESSLDTFNNNETIRMMKLLLNRKNRDKRIMSVFNREFSSIDDIELSNFKFYSYPAKYASLNAFNNSASNCVLNAIASQLSESELESKAVTFKKLHDKYDSTGVSPDDYKLIGKSLKVSLIVHHTELPNATKTIYKCRDAIKSIELIHQNNHAFVKHQVDNKNCTYIYVDSEDDLRSIACDKIDKIYSYTDVSCTFYNDNGSFSCYQLNKHQGVTLELGQTSFSDVLLKKLTEQITPFYKTDENYESYSCFTKHGVHFSTGNEKSTDIMIDMTKAYSNYTKLDFYAGLPKDISMWLQTGDLNETLIFIKDKNGFALVELISPLHNYETKIVWMLIPVVLQLAKHDLIINITHVALSLESFDLDTSEFIDINPELITIENEFTGEVEYIEDLQIGKRVFHHLLGMLCKNKSSIKVLTKDPLEKLGNFSTSLNIPNWMKYLAEDLEGYKQISYTYESKIIEQFSHITASIQDYTYGAVTLEFLKLKSHVPDANLVSALVDGFRIHACNLNGYKPSKLFSFKEVTYCSTAKQSDWNFIDVSPKKCNSIEHYFDLTSCYATYDKTFENLMSNQLINSMSNNKISTVYGYAGSGKSYLIKNIYKQFNSIILTPTHVTRLDYVNDGFNAISHQAAQHNPEYLKHVDLIILDECSMTNLADINRLFEVAPNKRFLLVGDPEQLEPFTYSSATINAKYDLLDNEKKSESMFDKRKDVIKNADEKAVEFDKIDRTFSIINNVLNLVTPSHIPTCNVINAGKFLTKIYRSKCDQLSKLSMDIRNGVITPNNISKHFKVHYYDADDATTLKDKLILTYRNSIINEINESFNKNHYNITTFRVIKNLTIKIDGVSHKIYNKEIIELIDGKFYNERLNVEFELTKEQQQECIKNANTSTFHAIQGQTIKERTIYIDLSLMSKRALYVAVTRAEYLSQIKFICLKKDIIDVDFDKKFDVEPLTIQHDLLKNSAFMVSKNKKYTQDCIKFDKLIADMDKLIAKQKNLEDAEIDKKTKKAGLTIYREIINKYIVKKSEEKLDVDKIISITRNNNGELTYKLDQPKVSNNIVDKYTEMYNTDVTYDYCIAAQKNDKRVFIWFHNLDDAANFTKEVYSFDDTIELHDVLRKDNLNNFFMDIDFEFKTSVDQQLLNQRENIFQHKLTTAFKSIVTENVNIINFSSRSRKNKVSIHMYTNLACDVSHMKQLALDIKNLVNDSELESAIDVQPYAINKSLSIPGGVKDETTQVMTTSNVYTHLFDLRNSIILDKYTVVDQCFSTSDNDESLLDEALKHITKCPLFDPYAMNVSYSSRNANCAHIQRVMPSECKGCNGHHSKDNTLRIYLYKNCAYAKCSRGGKSYFLCSNDNHDDDCDEELESLKEELNDAKTELELATLQIDSERIEEMEILIAELEDKIKNYN